MTELYPFSIPLTVRFNETDLQGHVNFAWYFNYFDVALTGYLKAIGFSYSKMLEEGMDLFYIDAHATYRSPCYFEDRLHVHCAVGQIGNTSMRFDFQVIREEDEQLVATGDITVITADRETHAKIRVPEGFRQAVEAYEKKNKELIEAT